MEDENSKNILEDRISNLKTGYQIKAAEIVAEYLQYHQEFIEIYKNWLPSRKIIIQDLFGIVDSLSKWKFGKDITQATGSSFGLIGGTLTIAGFALAPVTLGTSTILCAVGLGIGLTGGVTGLSGAVGETLATKSKSKTAQEKLFDDHQNTIELVKAYQQIKILVLKIASMREKNTACYQVVLDKLSTLNIKPHQFIPKSLVKMVKKEMEASSSNKNAPDVLFNTKSAVGGDLMKLEDDVTQVEEAASENDVSRGSSIVLGTVSSTNGVRDALAKYALVGIQSAQSVAVGISGVFIAVDIFQLLTAGKNLTAGSISASAEVLRAKAEQLMEQQLFFNEVYEYLRDQGGADFQAPETSEEASIQVVKNRHDSEVDKFVNSLWDDESEELF